MRDSRWMSSSVLDVARNSKTEEEAQSGRASSCRFQTGDKRGQEGKRDRFVFRQLEPPIHKLLLVPSLRTFRLCRLSRSPSGTQGVLQSQPSDRSGQPGQAAERASTGHALMLAGAHHKLTRLAVNNRVSFFASVAKANPTKGGRLYRGWPPPAMPTPSRHHPTPRPLELLTGRRGRAPRRGEVVAAVRQQTRRRARAVLLRQVETVSSPGRPYRRPDRGAENRGYPRPSSLRVCPRP